MPRIIVDDTYCKGELDHDTITAKGYHPAKLVDEEKCTGCTSCAIMCPDAAITVER